MTEPLDELMRRLAARSADRSLDGLEAEISRGIAAQRREALVQAAMAPVQIASVVLALAMGLTAGSALAASTVNPQRDYGLFASAARLAPSSLLEGR
ncbi:hypothetical protein E1H18_4585 [Caulobacter sp. RHG1]|nr:hypothetical protein [Caulobacter sp. RHG1]